MNRFFLLAILSGFIIFTSCKKDEEEFDYGYTYYPVLVGDYKIYQAQNISYQPNDTTVENFEIKEVVSEVFSIGGETRYRLERFTRDNNTLPWPASPDSVWTVALSNSKVIKVENNVRFVKLIFPVENGKAWNGNTENQFGQDEYVFQDVKEPYTVLAQTFPVTASVLQSPNDSTPVDKDYRMEVYAENIGMIYRVKEIYEYKQTCWGCGQIDDGIKYYERLISYGHQ